MTTTTATAAVLSMVWPSTCSDFTPAQQARNDEFRADIAAARRAHWNGYTFHIWIDGRYHDSAQTHADAFDECRAQRRAGVRDHMLIGSGFTDRTLTVSQSGRDIVRIELPAA
jgi:hypothetical protein